MGIIIRHLKIVDDLPFVPDVIAGGHHVNAHLEQFFGERWRDAEPRRRVLAIGDDKIDRVLLREFGQTFPDDGSPRPPENVTDEKNVQSSSQESRVSSPRNCEPDNLMLAR